MKKSALLVPWIWAILLGGTEPQEAASPPSKLVLAYNVLHDAANDNYEIFAMQVDGKEKRNISNKPGVDWVYYAYETKLYFLSDREAEHRRYHLYEMNPDGSQVRRICDFLLQDSWFSARHGGKEFVVCSTKDGAGHELYLIDQMGNQLERLTGKRVL